MSTASTSVASEQRFTRDHTCPICGGSETDPRGQQKRCTGFLSADGKYAHCSRDEVAGSLAMNPKSQTFAHKLQGQCRCGREHSPAEPKPAGRKKIWGPVDTTYDYVDENGVVLFQVVRHRNPKDFRQRQPNPSARDGWQWNLEGVRRVLYRLPELLSADPADVVVISEGEKATEAAVALGFIGTNSPHGAGKWKENYREPLKDRHVVILPDNDKIGRDHADDVGRSLHGIAASVKILDLAAACKALEVGELPEKGDLFDAKALGLTAEQLGHLIYKAPLWTPDESQDDRPALPEIVIEHMRPEDGFLKWTAQILSAFRIANQPPHTFQRGGYLSRVRRNGEEGPLFIESLSPDALRGVLGRIAAWGTLYVGKKGEFIKYGPPPTEIVKDFAALPDWDASIIPYLEMIVESPRFLPDGNLLLKPGYDPVAKLYYNPPREILGLEIPRRPTSADVALARSLLLDDLLVDFPFANQASRANAVACMLLSFVRLMIDGPTPLHMFEASTEGTGKGKLANACAYPSLGRMLPSTTQKEDEAEWRKAITTELFGGVSHLFFDNMYNPVGWDGSFGPVNSASLASALTQPVWTDRLLGGNKKASIKIECVWMASGNNVEWSKELARRIVPIRLMAPMENPSERTGFKHDLETWQMQYRVPLLIACLTLCQHWIAQGQPPGQQTMGSYEVYARVMGGILDAAEISGFLGNRRNLTSKDRESIRWPALVREWHKARGGMVTTAADLYDLMFGESENGVRKGGTTELQVAFADILGDGKELSQKQRLGNQLAKQEERVYAGLRIVRSEARTPGGSVIYRLEQAETSSFAPREPSCDDDREQGGFHGF